MDCKAGTPAQEVSALLQMPDKQNGQAGANQKLADPPAV
jgi:hypothetical protein